MEKGGAVIDEKIIGVWERLELTLGVGENRFTMSRGSFSYRQFTRRQHRMTLSAREETEAGLCLRYGHPSGARAAVRMQEEEGGVRLTLELPQNAAWNRFWLSIPANADEHIYGAGEGYATLDLKGERIRVWVAEHQNAKRIGEKIARGALLPYASPRPRPADRYESYYAQPTFVSSERYFVHADTTGYAEFDFRDRKKTTLYFQEPPVIHVGRAGSFSALSEKLTARLGRPGRLPAWVNDGAILAVQGGTENVEAKLAAARAAGAKICGIWSQDWCGCRRTGFGYQVMWNWEWDRSLYPALAEKIAAWRAEGVRFLGYINPFLALEGSLYAEAAAKGYCVKDLAGKDYLVTITTFPAAMVDLTNPAAYDWYKSVIRENMLDLGFGGWMADFGEYLPVDAVLWSGEDPAFLHNRWPVIWARLNAETIEESGLRDKVFFFTRAGYAGTAKWSPMMWTGDQHVDWSEDDGLPSVIPATLSLAMSGFGVTHSDVGGYTTVMRMRRTKELLMRWEEMNVFSPLFRFHEGNQPDNNVQFDADEDLLAFLAKTSGWHAGLKPYLDALLSEAAEMGTPVMRPLFYHYDEPAAYTEKTEYLLGRDVLVAPVLQKGAVSRQVYLPEDAWVRLLTGEEYSGGSYTVSAPIGQIPVFVRKDSPWRGLLQKAIQ